MSQLHQRAEQERSLNVGRTFKQESLVRKTLQEVRANVNEFHDDCFGQSETKAADVAFGWIRLSDSGKLRRTSLDRLSVAV